MAQTRVGATIAIARQRASCSKVEPPTREQYCFGIAIPWASVVRARNRLPSPAARITAHVCPVLLMSWSAGSTYSKDQLVAVFVTADATFFSECIWCPVISRLHAGSLQHNPKVYRPYRFGADGERRTRCASARNSAAPTRPPFRFLTSPLQRARRTCELAALATPSQLEPDLVEWDYGDYEGLRTAEIQEQHLRWNIFRDGCPGGESPLDVERRAERVIERLRGMSGNTLIFSSGHFLRVLAACWLGLEVSAARHWILGTTSFSALGYEHDASEPVIRLWNDTAHLTA